MRFRGEDQLLAMCVVRDGNYLMVATKGGYGKRTPVSEHTRHGRGTKGMIAIQTSERNGRMVAAILVDEPEAQADVHGARQGDEEAFERAAEADLLWYDVVERDALARELGV